MFYQDPGWRLSLDAAGSAGSERAVFVCQPRIADSAVVPSTLASDALLLGTPRCNSGSRGAPAGIPARILLANKLGFGDVGCVSVPRPLRGWTLDFSRQLNDLH